VEETGTYILRWDNSYSYRTSKTVSYSVFLNGEFFDGTAIDEDDENNSSDNDAKKEPKKAKRVRQPKRRTYKTMIMLIVVMIMIVMIRKLLPKSLKNQPSSLEMKIVMMVVAIRKVQRRAAIKHPEMRKMLTKRKAQQRKTITKHQEMIIKIVKMTIRKAHQTKPKPLKIHQKKSKKTSKCR